jgi:hypothetical protein
MKCLRSIALALAVCLAATSSVQSGGVVVIPPAKHHHGGGSGASPWAVWLIMGCASSIIFAAMVAYRTQGRELSSHEAVTCGFAYWLRPR